MASEDQFADVYDELPCQTKIYGNHKGIADPKSPTVRENPFIHRPLPLNPIHNERLHEEQMKFIQDNRVNLLQNLDLNHGYVIDHMIEKNALTEAEHEVLKSVSLRKERVSKLFDILKSKDYITFDIFIDGLKLDNSHCYHQLSEMRSEILLLDLGNQDSQNGSETDEYHLADIEDPYFLPKGKSDKNSDSDYDGYEDTLVATSIDKPLNTYECNPSYLTKFDTNVVVFKENCMLDITTALSELTSNVSAELENTSLSQNDSADIEKQTITNTPKCDVLDLFKESTINTVLKPFTRDASLFTHESTLIVVDQALTNLLHSKFANTKFRFGHTSFNSLVLLHEDYIKKLSDPRGEKWFYSAKVSSVQMERILSESNIKGSFYIYESTKSTNATPFNLSLITSDNLEIIHYHIHKTEEDEYYIKNKDKLAKFRNIHTLVRCYKQNRGNIACKLKWSPMEFQEYKPMFPSNFTIDDNQLEIMSSDNLQSNSSMQNRPTIKKGKYNDQMVIVKTTSSKIPTNLEEDDLLNEARMLQDIKHDNIRELVGVCFLNKRPYLVLGYAGSQNLHEYIRNNKTKVKVVMEIFVQLASALMYLCDKRFIIHRDIAARNCLVDSTDSEGVRVKLADFEMAVRVIQNDEYYADDDDRYSVRWASPEVIKEKFFSTKSDVWALGIVFWEMASGGQMPYTTLTTNAEVAATIVRGKVGLPIPKTEKVYSQIFKQIIDHCLAYKIEERYSARHTFLLSQQYLGKLCTSSPFDPIYGGLEADFSQLKHHSEEGKEKTAFNKIGKKLKGLVK